MTSSRSYSVPGDGVHVVRRGDEEDPAQVVLGLQIVVAEGVVVCRVQDLHQRGGGIAPPVAVELVELVQEHDRVVDAGLGEAVDDAPGHRANVGAAMPSDLGLVAHAAERHAHERSAERIGDALRDAALAGAGRAGETQDGGRLIGGVRRPRLRPHGRRRPASCRRRGTLMRSLTSFSP